MTNTHRLLKLISLGLSCVAVGTAGLAITAANRSLPNAPAPEFEVFRSVAQPDVGLRFIRNSGICEITPGVNQLSGYVDFGTNMSMVWFTGIALFIPCFIPII
jgi:hypothetical protein